MTIAVPRDDALRKLGRLVLLAFLACTSPLVAEKSARVPPRVLVIAIDAVSYDLIEGLTHTAGGGERIFPGLAGPAALINAFPSNSYTAWSGLLQPFGVDLPLGYEARYFNRDSGRLEGGLSPISVRAPWREFFDWHLKGVIRKAIAYGWPESWSERELRRGLDAFQASDERVFAMYIVSTDGLGHEDGPDGLAEFLRDMDRILAEFKRDHPEQRFYTFLFSDHGMSGGEPLENVWPAVRRRVREAGFRARTRLKGPRDAVVVSYGLLSSFVVYADPSAGDTLARMLAGLEGIDLCITEKPPTWTIHGDGGSARIHRIRGYGRGLWRYETIRGDPLDYGPVVERLRRRSGFEHAVWFPDRWWFETTRRHFYPDAIHRISWAFRLSRNPATIICSVAPGYMFGARSTDWIARPTIGRLRWTHGALHWDASAGFVMTDLPEWGAPDTVRFDEALEILVPYFEDGNE